MLNFSALVKNFSHSQKEVEYGENLFTDYEEVISVIVKALRNGVTDSGECAYRTG